MILRRTEHGRAYASFQDISGSQCRVQESSHGDPAIWIGFDVFLDKADPPAMMHLTQDMIRDLLPILQRFADTGYLWDDEATEQAR